jgi:3'-phosphoadenosine 5'-phosphosulfate synthase
MSEEELLECLHFRTYKNKLQSIPIIFPISEEEKQIINHVKKSGIPLNLVSSLTGKIVAKIETPSYYNFRKEEICTKLFGTFSKDHPKIQKYFNQGDYLMTGKEIKFQDKITFEDGLDDLRLTPDEIKKLKSEKKADVLYAFQVRNPLHNGHCMLLKEARNKLISDGYNNPILLLHPCGGWTKDDDVPIKVRIEQYKKLLEDNALENEHTILAIWPSPMYYAGPIEVLWHFSSRECADVDFMIVGRDPAGVKHPENKNLDLYDPTHGQKLLKIAYQMGLLKLNQIPFKPVFYNKIKKHMEFYDPSNSSNYENISGSEMRRLARDGLSLPENFMNENGWQLYSEITIKV